MRWWNPFKRLFRFQYLKLLRIKASTQSIAMGMSAGILAGSLPIIPFQIITALVLAFITRGNKIAAMLGTWISNPINLIPFYTMLYFVGKAVIPLDVHFDPYHIELEMLLEQGWRIVVVMFTGGLLVGFPLAFLGYILTFRFVNSYRKRRMIRLIKKYQHTKAKTAKSTSESGSDNN